ncbi:MAG: hypothetical protein Q4D98_09750 [Planctomycetia bacterium]|nr:hypothetical protein [Planctomycetia bacterium]
MLDYRVRNLSAKDVEYLEGLKKTSGKQAVRKTKRSESPSKTVKKTAPRNDDNDEMENESVSEEDSQTRVVIAEGHGETFSEAKKDAIRSAVEEVVGTLVDARTRVENDELIEKILTYSGAYIETSKVLKTNKEDGFYTVKIQAKVVKTAITQKLFAGKPKTYSVAGADLLGKMETKEASEKQGVMFLANFLKEEPFPYSLYDLTIVGEPKVKKVDGVIKYSCVWWATVDLEKYQDFAKRLTSILDKVAIRKGSFVREAEFDQKTGRINFATKNPVPGNKNFHFYVCTGVSGKYSSFRFNIYELPKKYSYLAEAYKNLFPVGEIQLHDADGDVVCSGRIGLNFPSEWNGDLCPFNMFPGYFRLKDRTVYFYSTHDFDAGNKVTDAIESTTCISKLYVEGRLSGVMLSPVAVGYSRGYVNVMGKAGVKTFTLTSEELSRVKSVSIQILPDNPAMDAIYEKMEAEINKIPTE